MIPWRLFGFRNVYLHNLLRNFRNDSHANVSLRTQTYFRLSLVSAEKLTAGNRSAFAGYANVRICKNEHSN